MKKRSLSGILVFVFSIMLIPSVKADTDNIRMAYSSVLKSFTYGDYTYQEQYPTYYIYDIDKNNVPELIVKYGTCEADYKYNFYTYKGGDAKCFYTTDGGYAELRDYPRGNGIVVYRSNRSGGCYLLSVDNGGINEQKIDPDAYGIYNMTHTLDQSYVNDATALYNCFDTNKASVRVESTETADGLSGEQKNQLSYYISNGYYFEAINLADSLLNTYQLGDSDTEYLNSCKKLANELYSGYLDYLNDTQLQEEIREIETYINTGMYLEAVDMCDKLGNSDISFYGRSLIRDLKTTAQNDYNEYMENTATESLSERLQNYMDNGCYLEVINTVNELLKKYNITGNERNTLEYYRSLAQKAYNEYINYMDQFDTYDINGWGLEFEFYKDMQMTLYQYEGYDDQYFEVYNNSDDVIELWSCEIGKTNAISNNVVYDVDGTLADLVNTIRNAFSWDKPYGYDFEVLSESDTTVGSLPARQVTFRGVEYTNRYKTQAEYSIMRLTAFQYGNWIYVISAGEDKYSWSDDFWNMMERVRNSIRFY